MMVDDHFYIGISKRTNNEGADQLINILKRHNMTGTKVFIRKMLHLKSGISCLENNNLLISGELKK
jgi:dimethylargininase